MVSTIAGVIDGIDSNIAWFTLFKGYLTKPQIWMGNFKHLIGLSLCYVKIMFNLWFMVPKTIALFQHISCVGR